MSLGISSCVFWSVCVILMTWTPIHSIHAYPSSVPITGLKIPLWGYPFDITEDTTPLLYSCQQDLNTLFGQQYPLDSMVCYNVEDDTDRITPTYRKLIYNIAQTSPLRISIAFLSNTGTATNISMVYNEFFNYMADRTSSKIGTLPTSSLGIFNRYVPYLHFTGPIIDPTKPLIVGKDPVRQIPQIQSLLEMDSNTLTQCTSAPLNPQYVLKCPDDNRYYAGQLGLGVAVTISILSLILCASCVYGIWNHHEQTRKRNNRRHVKKEMKKMILGDHNTDFKQQRLPVWTPRLTYPWVISTYTVVAILFLPIGWYTTFQQLDLVDVSVRYDTACESHINMNSDPFDIPTTTCQVNIPIPRDMFPPVYFYYQVSNMYQNHKRYVNSLNFKQLRNDPSGPVYSDCDPLTDFNNPALKDTYPDAWGKRLYPCGLFAQSFFTDSFNDVCVLSSDVVPCDSAALDFTRQGIAWKSDLDKRFVNASRPGETARNYYRGYNMTLNEDFVVWMRPGAMPTFSKLYGVIHTKLNAGETISVTVNNNYDVATFGGQKHIVLSTMSRIGGRSMFLGVAYILFGFLSLIMAIVFYARYRINEMQKED